MKSLKYLQLILVAIMAMGFSSAVLVTDGEWSTGANSLTIENGESAEFEAVFYASTSSMIVSVIMYEASTLDEIHTFLPSTDISSTSHTQIFTVTPDNYGGVGSYEVIFQGTDAGSYSDSFTLYLTVNPVSVVEPENNEPEINSIPDQEVDEGETFSYQVVATDPDGDTLTYSFDDAPDWLSIDSSTGLITGTAPMVDSDTDYDVEIIVSDGEDEEDEEFDLTVIDTTSSPTDTTAPIIYLTGNNPQTIQLGNPYIELGATASDNIDGDLSSSIIINSSLVNTSVVGLYNVTYNVVDSSGNQATEVNRTINVTSVPTDTAAPTITIISPKDKTYKTDIINFEVRVDEDATVSYSLNDGYNITMTETSHLVFEHERKLSSGDYKVIFYATDPSGNVGTKKVSFEIKKKSSNNNNNKNNKTEPIDYSSASTKEPSEIILAPANSTQELKLGYVILFLLAIGILIILLLIILITRARKEQQKIRQRNYREIFED